MSNQIVITSGAKLRDLDDVIIGTDGILSSVAFNVANGVPRLDENGKILVTQLPNSVMEFKGVWNAATNTPTLANGTGNAGDVWLCNEAGTVDFGDGPIYFAVGDYAVYTGEFWARSSGATGTVTSVGVSRDGNALAITGSPVTSSGTINLGFSGDNTQYINGAGNLTTFPTVINSIGLTMPAAFGVSNSPLTANGTIGVTALGFPSQYIRGDGTLADFPTSGGGGSSVSYYLNGGTSQGTIGGTTYYEMSKTADTGTMADFSKTGDGFIVAFLTDAGDPALLQIPAGNWNYEIYASMSANGGVPELYAELYVYNGTTFTLISTSSNEILYDGTNLNLYSFAMTVPETVLTVTDRLAIKLYATNSGGKTTTVHTQDSHLCQIITTFTTGLTALNGLTSQVQYFGTGTSGSDFNIVSSVDTHTFNIPSASATARGLITTGTQTIAGSKTITGTTTFTGGPILSDTNLTYANSGYTLVLQSPTLSVNRTVTLPNGTGTLALTSDISYPVTSVFGRTGAVVATSGDYTTTQVTEGLTNLYFTDARARAAISLTTTGSTGAATYNNTTGVLNIPNYADQYVGTVTSVAMSVPTGLTVSGSPITTSGTLAVTLTAGYSIPTTANQSTWTTAYNRSLTSAAVTGTTTKTLTLNQQDGGTITASWTDINTDAVTSVFGRTGAVVATEGDYTLTQLGDVTITSPTTGQVLKYNGTVWINDTDANTGTVTSVAMTVPTGLSIAGSPITSSGTLAVTFAAGYSIPTNASQTTWDTAYTNRITSLTTTGTSGAATLVANVLNIPNYGSALSGYLPLTGGTLTGPLNITYSLARFIIGDGTSAMSFGLWDTISNRIEASGTYLNIISYGGRITLSRSSGSILTVDTTDLTWTGTIKGEVLYAPSTASLSSGANIRLSSPTDSNWGFGMAAGAGAGSDEYHIRVFGSGTLNNKRQFQVVDTGASYAVRFAVNFDGTGTYAGTIVSGVWNGTAIGDSYISSAATWNAKQGAITLTTTGTSGASTFTSNTLNIPNYSLSGLGGIGGSGAVGKIPKFVTNTTTLGDSIMSEVTSYINIAGDLQVTSNEPQIYLNKTGTDAGSWRILGSTGGSARRFRIYDNTAELDRFIIFTNGNVSIDETTDQGVKLYVNGTGRFVGNLAVTAASGAVSLTLLTGTSYGYFYNDGTNIGLASNLGSTGLKLIVSRSAPDSSLVIASTGAATFTSTGSFGSGTLNGAYFIVKGVNGVPATTGTTTTAVLRLSSGTGLYNVLDFGTNEALDYSWIQSTRANSLGTYDKLLIQPNGGSVVIGGTATGGYKLYVDGTLGITGAATLNSTLNVGGVTDIQATRTAQLTLLKLSTTTLSSGTDDEISIDIGRGGMSKYSGRISGYISSFSTYDGGLKFYSSSAGVLNTTPQMQIAAGGTISVGSTSIGTQGLLQVYGNLGVGGSTYNWLISNTNDSNWGFGMYNSGSQYYPTVYFAAGVEEGNNRGFRVRNVSTSTNVLFVNSVGTLTASGNIVLKNNFSPAISTGSTGLFGNACGFGITTATVGATWQNDFFLTSGTANSYTFPNLTGTVAVMNGSGLLTITSLKTGAPTGDTAQTWKLGTAYSGSGISQTHYVNVEVNGVIYALLASNAV